MSYDACIRISVSVLTPNAFSIRKAIVPDRSARPSGNGKPPPEQVLTNLACAPAASVDFPLDLVQTVEYSKRPFRA